MHVISHPVSLAALVSCFLLVAVACDRDDAESTREPVVRPVKLLTVSPPSGKQLFRYPAVISAGQYAELSFQVNGLIEEVLVVESQKVSKGDVLARLEQRVFQNRVTTARVQYKSAVTEYQRAVRLDRENAIASSVLEQREAQKDVAKAQLDTAEKALEDSILRAPFSGDIAQVFIRKTQNVSAGQPIVKLINVDTLEVSIDMAATLVAQSQEYDNLGNYVILDAAPNERMKTTLKESTLLADSATQTYRLTGTFIPPANLMVLPGMNATVEIDAVKRSESKKISVPLAAIFSDGDEKYVWVVDNGTMVVSRREVTVADGIGEFVIVTEGLAASDTIAIAGASYLADGMQVRPWKD